MSRLGRRKKGFSWTSIVILCVIVIAVAIAILSSGPGDAEIYNYENGFRALEAWSGDTGDNIEELLRFVVFPFFIILVLLYTAIDAGLGHTMKSNIRRALAVGFAAMTFISPWFITISAALNFYGIPGMIVLALLSIFVGAMREGSFFSLGGWGWDWGWGPSRRNAMDDGKSVRDRTEELEDMEDRLKGEIEGLRNQIEDIEKDSGGSVDSIPGIEKILNELQDIKGALEDREELEKLIDMVEEALNQSGSEGGSDKATETLKGLDADLRKIRDMHQNLTGWLDGWEEREEAVIEQTREDLEEEEDELDASDLPDEIIGRKEALLDIRKEMLARIDSINDRKKSLPTTFRGRIDEILRYNRDIVSIGEDEEVEEHYRHAEDYYNKAKKRLDEMSRSINKMLNEKVEFSTKYGGLTQEIEALKDLAFKCVRVMKELKEIKRSHEFGRED